MKTGDHSAPNRAPQPGDHSSGPLGTSRRGVTGDQSTPIGGAGPQHPAPTPGNDFQEAAGTPSVRPVEISAFRSTVTAGSYPTEADAVEALDRILDACGLFYVHREKAGVCSQLRVGQTTTAVRIDRLLTPTARLEQAGWEDGAIGIEAKRSGEKVGPALAQMGDYLRSVFPCRGGVHVTPAWVFLWPCAKQHGDNASFMQQGRLGSVWLGSGGGLIFHAGEARVLTVRRSGNTWTAEPGPGRFHGRRTGSR